MIKRLPTIPLRSLKSTHFFSNTGAEAVDINKAAALQYLKKPNIDPQLKQAVTKYLKNFEHSNTDCPYAVKQFISKANRLFFSWMA